MQREMWICVICKSSPNHPDAVTCMVPLQGQAPSST